LRWRENFLASGRPLARKAHASSLTCARRDFGRGGGLLRRAACLQGRASALNGRAAARTAVRAATGPDRALAIARPNANISVARGDGFGWGETVGKTPVSDGKLVLARERIYPAAVRRHVLAVLSELRDAAAAVPARVRHCRQYADPGLDGYSPYGWVEHALERRFLALSPRREHMHQWVQSGVMHFLGAAATRLTGFRPIVVPFLFDQALARGVGYLTRAATTPDELARVAAAAAADVEAGAEDCVFAAILPPPPPEFWEPENWPKFVTLVDVDAER